MKLRKFLIKTTFYTILLTIMFIFTSCTYVGKNNIEMFSEKFNEYNKDEIVINQQDIIINKEDKSYYYFFPVDNENEYLLSIFENEEKEIYEFGICIVKNSKIDLQKLEKIFNGAFYSLISSYKETPSPFNELPINDKGEIKNLTNKTIEYDLFNINILINDAGTGIYVVKK